MCVDGFRSIIEPVERPTRAGTSAQGGVAVMQRYEYKFIQMPLKGGWWSGEVKPDFERVIVEQAELGWRLVTIFAPAVSGYGRATQVHMIFEKPV
jgi:hypothetical protein